MKQTTFASMSFAAKKHRTPSGEVPGGDGAGDAAAKLVALIEPYYSKSGRHGRPPMTLESMLRIYSMQRWYALKGTRQHPLTAANQRTSRKRSAIRARVEHVFRVIKRQFGYTKVPYWAVGGPLR